MIDGNIIVGTLLGLFLVGFIYKLYLDERKRAKNIDNILKGHK